MMAQMENGTELERLKRVVAAYGAQPGRWPAQDRRALAALALEQGTAPWMVAAAELDQMLDLAESGEPTVVSRVAILAAVSKTPQHRTGQVVSIDQAPARDAPVRAILPWAAVLAASLLVGMWAGANGAVELLLPGSVGDALMAVNESEDESNFFGLFDPGPGSAGEDVI